MAIKTGKDHRQTEPENKRQTNKKIKLRIWVRKKPHKRPKNIIQV